MLKHDPDAAGIIVYVPTLRRVHKKVKQMVIVRWMMWVVVPDYVGSNAHLPSLLCGEPFIQVLILTLFLYTLALLLHSMQPQVTSNAEPSSLRPGTLALVMSYQYGMPHPLAKGMLSHCLPP